MTRYQVTVDADTVNQVLRHNDGLSQLVSTVLEPIRTCKSPSSCRLGDERTADQMQALYRTGAGTGAALAGSTISSVVGFMILAFAPVPMFASFGLLTAVMIVFALLASLVVLLGLLLLGTR